MFPYEQLEVYKKAYEANQKVYRFLKGNKSIATYIKSQLGRASLSIMLNIAEGSANLASGIEEFTYNSKGFCILKFIVD